MQQFGVGQPRDTASRGAQAGVESSRAQRALTRLDNERALVLAMRARRLDPRSNQLAVPRVVADRVADRLVELDATTIIAAMSPVEGWLTPAEAALLARAAATAAPAGGVVEIGSYCGRSTVTIALAMAVSADRAGRLTAIDPHDGYLPAGGRDSYHALLETLRRNAVEHLVEVVRARSTEVPLEEKLAMAFIDGLHDLASVRADRDHVLRWLGPHGLLAFHDYRPDYPGVVDAVDEALLSGDFVIVGLAESLIVLRRL